MLNYGRNYQNREYAPFARKVWQQQRVEESTPATALVSVDDMKNWLGVPLCELGDDDQITGLIEGATQQAEKFTGRAFINRTVKSYFDYVPWLESTGIMGTTTSQGQTTVEGGRIISLRRSPLVSVERIAWHYIDGTTTDNWSTDNYLVDTTSQTVRGRVVIKETVSMPTDLREANALEIEYTAGYGANAADVPYTVKQAVQMLVAYNYNNRGDCGSNGANPMQASGAQGLLMQHRLAEVI